MGSQEGRCGLRGGVGVTVHGPGDREGAHLPALVGRAVVRVMLGDVCVDAAQGQLSVLRGRDGLHDELSIRVRRLRLVLGAQTRG